MSDQEIRKLAAIMFTDMVGYGALSQRDDKLALELLEEHRELLRKIFPRSASSKLRIRRCVREIARTQGHRVRRSGVAEMRTQRHRVRRRGIVSDRPH